MGKKEETAVVESTKTEVAVQQDMGEWGESNLTSQDIIIPKLLLMQGQSDLVQDGKAKTGDIVDNTSSAILGGSDKPLEIIPFHMEKVWIISEKKKGDSRFEFVKYEAVTPQNINQAWNETIGDLEVKREYTLQFYCLTPSDLTLPFVVSFKSTSARAGKVLSTQMYVRNRGAGLVPPAYHMTLTTKKEKNDQGTYAVYEVKQSKQSTQEEIKACLDWFKIVKAGKTTVSAEAPEAQNYASDNVAF